MILLSLLLGCSPTTPNPVPKPLQTKTPPDSSTFPVFGQQLLHEGRFSIDMPSRLRDAKITRTPTKVSSNVQLSMPHALWSIDLEESLVADEVNAVDAGMVAYVAKSVTKNSKILQTANVRVAGGGMAKIFVLQKPNGKKEHLAIFPADHWTLAMVWASDRKGRVTSKTFRRTILSFRVEKPSQAVAPAKP